MPTDADAPRHATARATSRRWLILGECALALLLVTALVVAGDIDGETVSAVLVRLRGWPAAAVLALAAAQVYLSARKWAYVLGLHGDHAPRPTSFYLRHTATGMLLGQVLPTQVGTAAMRAAALHASGTARPLVTGTYTSLFEQAFDVLVPLALVPASLLAVYLGWRASGWVVAAGLGVALGALGVAVLGACAARARRAPAWLGALRRRWHLEHAGEALRALLTPRALLTLWSLSALRYALVLLRTALVAQALGLGAATWQVAMAAPVVQCVALAAVTPGALGVVEWGWVGLLQAWAGATLARAAEFALAMRLSFLLALALLALLTRLWAARGAR